MNTVTHGGARAFRKQGGRGGRGGRGRRGNDGQTTNGSTGGGSSNGNNGGASTHGGDSAGNALGGRGNGRGSQASGGNGRGRGRDNGRNSKGLCRYCHNSKEHGWNNCPLRLSQEAEEAKEQAAHVTQESTTQAWFTRIERPSSVLEDFAIVIGDDTQVQTEPADYMRVPNAPAAALPETRAADNPQAQKVPGAAQPEERAAGVVQVQDVPAAVLHEKRTAGDVPVKATLAATTNLQAEKASDGTEYVAYTNVFQVEQVNPSAVGDTTVYIDSAASSHMVCTESRLSKHVRDPVDCAVRIIGSCGTSNATKKGTLKFGIRNDKNNVVPVALEVLLVRNLGANILSVGALAEKGVMCDLLSTPPALRNGNHVFPISTAVRRMYVVNVIIDDVNLDAAEVCRTKVDADMWHRRMGHCHPRALQQLADKAATGVEFNRNIEPGDCGVCAVGDSKKGSHPPSNRTRAATRFEILSADVWGPHPLKSYGGCQSAVMFTDDLSRMRFGFLLKTKDGVAESLQELIQNEADPLGTCIGKVHCDGGAEFKGRFQALCESMGIKLDNSAPYVPQGNAIAERGFGTIIGTARKLLLGAPHLPGHLWGEAFQTAIYLKNRTPTEVLGGKAPLEVWEGKPLGSMSHLHEWGSVAYKHEEARFRSTKLSARAKKLYHVGYNTKTKTYRLWDPAEPLKITNSAEVSFREKETRDVVKPKAGHDPFSAMTPTTIYLPDTVDT